jgi:hypothetical protein
VLHFFYDFLGARFFRVPEMEKVNAFLERSQRGIRITGKTRKDTTDLLLRMEHQEGVDQVILLLSILNLLASSDDLSDLSSEGFANSIDESGSNRLNKVYEYIMNNFQEDISLLKVAAVANMSPTAFKTCLILISSSKALPGSRLRNIN